MGTYDEDWAKLDKRLPLDLAFGAQAILIHNILTYPVYKERKRVENQEQQQENSKSLLILSSRALWTDPWQNFFQYFEIMVLNDSMKP